MIKGKDLVLYLDGNAVAASTGCDIDIKRDYIETCSPTDGAAQTFIPGTYGWTGSVSVLGTPHAQVLVDAVIAGKKFAMKVRDTEAQLHLYGECYIDSTSISGSVGNLVKGNIKLLGTGELRNYSSIIDISDLTCATCENGWVSVDEEGEWSIDGEDTDGCGVIELPAGRDILVENYMSGSVVPVLLNSAGVTAEQAAETIMAGIKPQTGANEAVIANNGSVVLLKHPKTRFLIVNWAESYTENVGVYAL